MMTEVHDIDIQKILPQAAPFIMIDAVTDYQPGKSLTAVKNITANEWSAVQPGFGNNTEPAYSEVLLIEAAAQTAVLFARLSENSQELENDLYVLGRIKVEFVGSAGIGDQIRMEISKYKMMRTNGFIVVEIKVETQRIARLNIFYSRVEKRSHG